MKRKRITPEEHVGSMDMSEVLQTCIAQTVIAVSMLKSIDPNDWYADFQEVAGIIIDAQRVLSCAREELQIGLEALKFTPPVGMSLQKIHVAAVMRNEDDGLPF